MEVDKQNDDNVDDDSDDDGYCPELNVASMCSLILMGSIQGPYFLCIDFL